MNNKQMLSIHRREETIRKRLLENLWLDKSLKTLQRVQMSYGFPLRMRTFISFSRKEVRKYWCSLCQA